MSIDMRQVSVVIPTYRRGTILLDTLRFLFELDPSPGEILVVDQTEIFKAEVADELRQMEAAGRIRLISFSPPSIPQAMNQGLLEARGEVVLFLDDDIIPDPALVDGHWRAHAEHPEAWAVVGQVIQPEDGDGEKAESRKQKAESGGETEDNRQQTAGGRPQTNESQLSVFIPLPSLTSDLDFCFNGTEPAWVENVMAGNLSVSRKHALALGGFDLNFIPPVSYRFETEFAKRLIMAGGRIRFEPAASIRHRRAMRGGTRSIGSHLASLSPLHGVGDYYYALRCGQGWGRVRYMLRRPLREVCTRFHLRKPWWIPVKFFGELRAMALAFRLYWAGPGRLATERRP